jgi:CBS domain-containing protein
MTDVDAEALISVLTDCPPLGALGKDRLTAIAGEARISRFGRGEVVLDAFTEPATDVFVVVAGRVDLWNGADRISDAPDETLGPCGLFGFSAALTERAIGPRAVAATDVVVARLPAAAVTPAFATAEGARFLAEQVSARRGGDGLPGYTVVDELITHPPLLVPGDTSAAELARRMTRAGLPWAAVRLPGNRFGLITDATLRATVLAGEAGPGTPVGQLVHGPAPAVEVGDSAAEALITMLERDAEFVLVTDRAGDLRGVVGPRDFLVSSTTAGVALHEQLRRAGTVEELQQRAGRVPELLADLLARGTASAKVITVHSAIVDSVARRAIQLVTARHPGLSSDAFTWLSLGSNGRREAVLSSDVDAAVAFDDDLTEAQVNRYRPVLTEIVAVLSGAGLTGDGQGATPANPAFARTNAQWRDAALQWLAHPVNDNGAMMTSLLVDGRPIHGDPGLPAVARVFGELRRHPGTMRLLLQESLAKRARPRGVRDLLGHHPDRIDVKQHALLPIVNLARWMALSSGSAALPTIERLRSASGSPMLPEAEARTLIEVFEVLQRLRLRYQLRQLEQGERPSDVVVMGRLSPIDRSIIDRAVREVAAAQRRADNVAHYVDLEGWVSPEPTP